METLARNLKVAVRGLSRTPTFTLTVVLTLALGIGVNSAIFSVVYAVLLRPLAYEKPEQLALLWSSFEKSTARRAPTSGPALWEIRQRTKLLQDVAGIWVGTGTFTGDSNPEQMKVGFITTNFLSLLGVRPVLGRVFGPEEEAGGRFAIVLSNGLWKRRFGADPNIVGKGVAFQGANATVLGVLPEDFQLHFPPDSNVPSEVGAFLSFGGNLYKRPRTVYFLRLAARLKPGVTIRQAQEDMNSVAAQIRGAYTEYAAENMQIQVVGMQADAAREDQNPLRNVPVELVEFLSA